MIHDTCEGHLSDKFMFQRAKENKVGDILPIKANLPMEP